VLRQRIQQSGMTADQIRARLQASGYPSNLLDAYLGAGGPGAAVAQPGATELAAIQALGLPAIVFPAESLPLDTGSSGCGRDGAAQPRVRRGRVPTHHHAVPAVARRSRASRLQARPRRRPGPDPHGDVELAYTLQVTREGFILIPQVGQVFVSNLTLDQLRDLLYTRLGRVYSG